MISSYVWRSRRAVYWLSLGSSIAALIVFFLPTSALIQICTSISPAKNLQDKTVLLLQVLKYVLPAIGLVGVVWLHVPTGVNEWFVQVVERVGRSRWTMPCILLFSWMVRLAWVAFYPAGLHMPDSQWYFDRASLIAQGMGYVWDAIDRTPTAYFPVGYPAFLAVLFFVMGPNLYVAEWANVAVEIITVALVYQVGLRIFNHGVGIIAAVILSLLPGYIVYSSLVSSDSLSMMLVVCIVWIVLTSAKPRFYGLKGTWVPILLGVTFGISGLVRPMVLGLFPFWITLWQLALRKSKDKGRPMWEFTLGLIIGTSLILVPWAVRNSLVFRQFVLVSNNGGLNFWIGNNPHANGTFFFPQTEQDNPLYVLNDQVLRGKGDEVKLDRLGYEFGFEFIRSHPLDALALFPAKLFYLYNSNDYGVLWNRTTARTTRAGAGVTAQVLANLAYTLLCLFASLGFAILIINDREPLKLAGSIFFCIWTLLNMPFFGQDRYALPILPFDAMYAAYGILALVGLKVKGIGHLDLQAKGPQNS